MSAGEPAAAGGGSAIQPSEVDVSCRLPLMVLFLGAAVWLLLGSLVGLLNSIKFHSPNFLAAPAWLTYGRLRPASLEAMLYGGAIQAGLGVALWLLARLGGAVLARPGLATVGAFFWNLGMTLGIAGILRGDGTGFEYLELPPYAASLLALGYLLLGICGVLTFHRRRERLLFASQWFVLAALFWFPWIHSTAELLLVAFPVRGVAQSVIAWWYADNLLVVWFGLVGLAAVFYFVPKLAGRNLHSHYLALFTFWTLILFGGWGGIPTTAPVPAWMPVISTVAAGLMLVPILAVVLSFYRTSAGSFSILRTHPSFPFIAFGVFAFVVSGLMRIASELPWANQFLRLTWFASAQEQLNTYGFFTMVMFGAIYYVLPQLTGTAFPHPKLVRVHFWLSLLGVLFGAVPLVGGGIAEGLSLQNANIPFLDIQRTMLRFLRVSTIGDLLLLLGHVVFLGNLLGLAARFYVARAASAYAAVTAPLGTAEVRP
jgi:cytochrome c oxidase cbb3-type subunit I